MSIREAIALDEPCPFCGKALSIRGGVNPYGRCDTEGCWMHARAIVVPLNDHHQVAAWNTRASTIGNEAALREPEGGLRVRVSSKRKSLGWSLRDLEAETGIGFSTLARFERGERIGNRVRAHLIAWACEPTRAALPPQAPDGVETGSSDACTCQRFPTHCANDCPQHGLEEPVLLSPLKADGESGL